MITFNPPVIKPYAPATQPIAKIAVGISFDEATGRNVPEFTLVDANNRRIVIDPSGLPQSKITPEQLSEFASEPTIAGQTLAQSLATRAKSILATCYGLSGGKIE